MVYKYTIVLVQKIVLALEMLSMIGLDLLRIADRRVRISGWAFLRIFQRSKVSYKMTT